MTNPVYVGFSESPEISIDHNLYIKGDFAYMTNYQTGLRINHLGNLYDETNQRSQLAEIGYFDTDLVKIDKGFFATGAWSSYIYFPSGNIVTLDKFNGLFAFTFNDPGVYTMHPTRSPTTRPSSSPTYTGQTDAPSSSPTYTGQTDAPSSAPTSAPTSALTSAPSGASTGPEASSSAPVIGVAVTLALLILASMVYYFKIVEPREKAKAVGDELAA